MNLPIIKTNIIHVDSSQIKDIDTKDNKKVIMIYGENCSGKTTFSECLRVQSKEENKYSIQYIDLQEWKDKIFYVYNKHFVNENVFNTDLKFDKIASVIIGKNLIEKYESISKDSKQIRSNQDEIRILKSNIENLTNQIYKNKINLENDINSQYELLYKDNDIIKDNLLKLEEQLDTINKFQIEKMHLYESLNLDIEENEIKQIINKQITPLSKEVEKEIFKFCNYTNLNINWYKEGIKAIEHTDNKCPFCQQDLNNETTRKLIDDYKKLIENEELQKLETYINSILKKLKTIDIIFSKNINNSNQIVKENFKLNIEVNNKLKSSLTKLEKYLNEKINKPNIVVDIDIDDIFKNINDYKKHIDVQNDSITKHNSEIERILKNLENINNINNNMKIYNNILKNKEQYLKLIDDNKNFEQEKNNKENILKEIEKNNKELISKNIKDINDYEKLSKIEIDKYSDKINELLKYFSVDFSIESNIKIENDKRKKSLGDFNSQYNIKRNNQNIDKKLIDYSLSESEKNLLGFCFFIAQLPENDENAIIVLDDPVTSFDENRSAKTSEYIHSKMNNFYKILVLTHNKEFTSKLFYELEGNVLCLKLSRTKFTNDRSKIINSKDYLHIDPIIDEYKKLLIYKGSEDLNAMHKSSRKIIEKILVNAYLYSITDPNTLVDEYYVTSINQKSHKRSLEKKIMEKRELNESNNINELIKIYGKLSKDEHGSNDEMAMLNDSEKEDLLSETINIIHSHFLCKYKKEA